MEREGEATFQVMVVNDDAAQLTLLSALLKKDGCLVTSCSSAEEAMEGLESLGEMDLLITDLNMPGLSGLQLLYRLRELDIGLPVLVISASEHESARARIEREKGHLLAPYTITKVRAAAKALLKGEKTPHTEAEPVAPGQEIDEEAVAKLRMVGGATLVTKVVGMFLAKTPNNLSTIRSAIDEGDHHTVERTAHTIKGSAGMLGARTVQKAAKNLELAGSAQELSNYTPLADALESSFQNILPFFEALCQTE